MADTRDRRAAERDAREWLSGKVAFIGDVAMAASQRAAALKDVETAAAKARALVERARADGEELIRQARARAGEADVEYEAVFRRAVDEGWSPAQLSALGYATPRPPVRGKRPAAASAAGLEAGSSTAPPGGGSTGVPAAA